MKKLLAIIFLLYLNIPTLAATYLFACFVFLQLALAIRSNRQWLHPLVVEYVGAVIWANMILFLLLMIFLNTALWKLVRICYTLGAADECSQLYSAPRANSILFIYWGRLKLGACFYGVISILMPSALCWRLSLSLQLRKLYALKKAIGLAVSNQPSRNQATLKWK